MSSGCDGKMRLIRDPVRAEPPAGGRPRKDVCTDPAPPCGRGPGGACLRYRCGAFVCGLGPAAEVGFWHTLLMAR
jgi:hypothetical protein